MSVIKTFVLACAVSFAYAAENNLPVVTAMPAVVTEGNAFDLVLAGNAPDACGYLVSPARIDSDVITVTLKRPEQICADVISPFRILISPFSAGSSARAGTYKVRIELQQGSTAPRLLAFTLVPVLRANAAPLVPEAGNWNYEPGGRFANSGSGVNFLIERQGPSAVVVANFYDSSGAPVWYFNAGPMQAHVQQGLLYDVRGGQALFGAYKPPSTVEPIGKLAVEFATPTRATVWISQPIDAGLSGGLKLMPISISRFNFGYGNAPVALTGNWVLASEVAGGSETRQLNLLSIAGTGNTVASYSDGEFRLNCALDPVVVESLAGACVLLRSGLQVASFEQVGFTRLRGRDGSGKPISMFKVD